MRLTNEQKQYLGQKILKYITHLSIYPDQYTSDTTIITYKIVNECRGSLFRKGIFKNEKINSDNRFLEYHLQPTVLRLIHKLEKNGYIKIKLDYGGEGKGRNWTFLRLRLTLDGCKILDKIEGVE